MNNLIKSRILSFELIIPVSTRLFFKNIGGTRIRNG